MYLKIILFILLLIFTPISNAETIVGSTMELVNGSGSFTWTSQNFPALRGGDTIKINVVNNTIKSGDLVYTMNSYPISDLFSEVFPSDALYTRVQEIKDHTNVINFLFNKYLVDGSYNYLILIDKNNYKLHSSDKLIFEYSVSITQNHFEKNGHEALINNKVVVEGEVSQIHYHSHELPDLFIFSKKIFNNEHEIQGIIQVLHFPYTTPPHIVDCGNGHKYGKLETTENCYKLNNYEEILLSGNVIDITDNFKLIINSNKLDPSATINYYINTEFVPSPTPIPTTPIQNSTPTPTLTPCACPAQTPTPYQNQSATPLPTSTQSLITSPTITPIPTISKLKQEVKEPINNTEDLDLIISWIVGWLKTIFG